MTGTDLSYMIIALSWGCSICMKRLNCPRDHGTRFRVWGFGFWVSSHLRAILMNLSHSVVLVWLNGLHWTRPPRLVDIHSVGSPFEKRSTSATCGCGGFGVSDFRIWSPRLRCEKHVGDLGVVTKRFRA